MTNEVIEICKNRFKENLEKKIIDPSLEVLAINNLTKKEDILNFHKEYLTFMGDFITNEVENNNISHSVRLVKGGYSIDEVAKFFVNDGLMYTMGHMFNKNANIWENTIPKFNKSKYKEMYNY
jgi:hypothetical protein